MADEIPAYMYPYVPYSSPYLLLPLPFPIPITTLLLPLPTAMSAPAFLEGWGQDRVRGRHLTAKYYYRGVVRFWPIQSGWGGGGGGGGGVAHVACNTEYFNVLLEVGGPLGMPTTYYPYSSPYLLLPLLLPLPTTTPTPPLTYYYPYSSPYLLLPLLLPLPTIPLVHGVR